MTHWHRDFLTIIPAEDQLCAGIPLKVGQERRSIRFHSFRVHLANLQMSGIPSFGRETSSI